MDSRRKWEEMNPDCLVNIFGRLDLESRLADVPFVCKHWHTTLISNPLCWQSLFFSKQVFKPGSIHGLDVSYINIHQLIKFVVDRSQGCATTLVLPDFTNADDLIYVSDVCPNLKVLSLAYLTSSDNYEDTLSEVIVKFKSLEILHVASCINIVPIFHQIRTHCDKFLRPAVVCLFIDFDVASATVTDISTIKWLTLDGVNLKKRNLMLILQRCKQLEQLCVRKYFGFDDDDEEIPKFASHINDFKCENSTHDDSFVFFADIFNHDPISSRDVDG